MTDGETTSSGEELPAPITAIERAICCYLDDFGPLRVATLREELTVPLGSLVSLLRLMRDTGYVRRVAMPGSFDEGWESTGRWDPYAGPRASERGKVVMLRRAGE